MAGVRRREAGPVSSSSSSRGERRRVVIGGGGGGGGGMMTKAALACVAMVAVSALVLTAEAFWVGPYHPAAAPRVAAPRAAGARGKGQVQCSAAPRPLTTWWRDPEALREQTGEGEKKKATGGKVASSSSSSSSSNSGGPSLFQNPLAGWDLRRAGFALFTPMLLAFGGSVTPGVVSPGGGAAAVSVAVGRPPAAHAIDSIKVGSCLLQNCQLELARCILDPKCLANIICLNTCNGRPDEAGCQIGCGDLFENDVVGQFNACALSKKQCVPQKKDDGSYPYPPEEALVKQFSMDEFKGKWYISAGLNPLFDVFDCQVHFFTVQNGKLYGKLNWRITEPDGEFFTRNTVQRFVQDPEKPGILYNHDNEYLHYQDDWYILDYEPQQFIAVYYRGRNDAWNGYGGAVVYTREPSVPAKYKDRIKAAFAKANVDYGKFKEVDNSCKDLTESPTALRAEFARRLFLTEEQQLQEALTTARVTAENAIMMGEEEAQTAVKELERVILDYEQKLEKEAVKDVRKLEQEIERDIERVERVIDTRIWGSSNKNKLDSLEQRLQSRPLNDPRPAVN